MWGGSEPFISLKSWMAGGGVKILADVVIGHMFRDEAPYATETRYLIYNKLFMCHTLLPPDVAKSLIGELPGDKAVTEAYRLVQRNALSIFEERSYYERVFTRSFQEYCERFGVSYST